MPKKREFAIIELDGRKFVAVDSLAQLYGVSVKSMRKTLRRKKIKIHSIPFIEVSELDRVATRVALLPPSEALEKQMPIVSVDEYSELHGVSKNSCRAWYNTLALKGFTLFHRIFIVNAPPSDTRKMKAEELLNRVISKYTRNLLSAAALIRVSYKELGRRALKLLAEQGKLFKFGRFYYMFYDRLGRSIYEIRLIYSNPNELMVPRPLKFFNWNDMQEVNSSDM